jgi:hypothetical protein
MGFNTNADLLNSDPPNRAWTLLDRTYFLSLLQETQTLNPHYLWNRLHRDRTEAKELKKSSLRLAVKLLRRVPQEAETSTGGFQVDLCGRLLLYGDRTGTGLFSLHQYKSFTF